MWFSSCILTLMYVFQTNAFCMTSGNYVEKLNQEKKQCTYKQITWHLRLRVVRCCSQGCEVRVEAVVGECEVEMNHLWRNQFELENIKMETAKLKIWRANSEALIIISQSSCRKVWHVNPWKSSLKKSVKKNCLSVENVSIFFILIDQLLRVAVDGR